MSYLKSLLDQIARDGMIAGTSEREVLEKIVEIKMGLTEEAVSTAFHKGRKKAVAQRKCEDAVAAYCPHPPELAIDYPGVTYCGFCKTRLSAG